MTEDITSGYLLDTVLGKWRRRKWLFIVSFVAVFSLFVSVVVALPSLYRSSTTILFGQDEISESLVKESAPNELELRLGIIRQEVMSRSQLQEVIDKFSLYAPLRASSPPESVIERLRKDIHIEQTASAQPQWQKNTTFAITISYQGWNAELVARVTNDLAARFEAENRRIRTRQAARTTEFIQQQLEASKKSFLIQEQRINTFKNEHMGELPEQQQLNLVTLERLNSELRLNGDKIMQLLSRRDAVMLGAVGGQKVRPLGGISDSMRLEMLEQELADLQSRYTENYPGIIHVKHEIRTLIKEIKRKGGPLTGSGDAQMSSQNPAEIDRTLAVLKAEEVRLHERIANLMDKIEGTPIIDQQLKQFAYDYDSTKGEYQSLQKKHQDALLAQSLDTQQSQQFKIIEVAIPSAFPAVPNRFRMIFIGFMLSAGLAGFAVFLVEQLDQSFHSVGDVRHFTNIPVLASIASIQTIGDKMRSISRFGLVSVFFITGIMLITGLGYYAGKNGEQLVWAIST